jgi:hypothetical protein
VAAILKGLQLALSVKRRLICLSHSGGQALLLDGWYFHSNISDVHSAVLRHRKQRKNACSVQQRVDCAPGPYVVPQPPRVHPATSSVSERAHGFDQAVVVQA